MVNPIDRLNIIVKGFPEPVVFRTIFEDREEWRNKKGQLHRDNDKPAVVWDNGVVTDN